MDAKPLGILTPLGGGDPIPLRKEQLVVGRRPTSDVRLDFENVSGKHCVLRFLHGVWHVKDLGSTNGTTVNGQKIMVEHSIMPDDELGVASHYFHIDYEPAGPSSIADHTAALAQEEELVEQRKQHSLLELAGLSRPDIDRAMPNLAAKLNRPKKPPERIVRLSADEAEFEDALPEHAKAAPPPPTVKADDEDFLKMIEEEVPKPPPRGDQGKK